MDFNRISFSLLNVCTVKVIAEFELQLTYFARLKIVYVKVILAATTLCFFSAQKSISIMMMHFVYNIVKQMQEIHAMQTQFPLLIADLHSSAKD